MHYREIAKMAMANGRQLVQNEQSQCNDENEKNAIANKSNVS